MSERLSVAQQRESRIALLSSILGEILGIMNVACEFDLVDQRVREAIHAAARPAIVGSEACGGGPLSIHAHDIPKLRRAAEGLAGLSGRLERQGVLAFDDAQTAPEADHGK